MSGPLATACWQIDPPPCELGCTFLEQCQRAPVACQAFVTYTKTGDNRGLPTKPSERQYRSFVGRG